jgi:hypothetical protein
MDNPPPKKRSEVAIWIGIIVVIAIVLLFIYWLMLYIGFHNG